MWQNCVYGGVFYVSCVFFSGSLTKGLLDLFCVKRRWCFFGGKFIDSLFVFWLLLVGVIVC